LTAARSDAIPGGSIARPLLAWFDKHARDLPWRRQPNPYRTLVSELMLQQTVVATVIPYFERFITRWPDLPALARASQDDVLAMWSGLGYYTRARNLHRVARMVEEAHGGQMPGDEDALRALPGIGPYTAAAVAAIGFGRRCFALDGNAARVVARLAAVSEPIDKPATRARLHALGQTWVPAARAGAFAEAVMELGATVCTPRAPACSSCPLQTVCRARAQGTTALIPTRSPRRTKTVVRVAFARLRRRGRVLLVRRQAGLLAGMWSLPTLPRGETSPDRNFLGMALGDLGLVPRRAVRAGEVRHIFTHRDVTAEVFDCATRESSSPGGDTVWADEGHLDALAISSFLRKLLDVPSASAKPARKPSPSTGRPVKQDKRRKSP
jgi:A/G-specific adenine glycosylase